jgi:hypothetical protein
VRELAIDSLALGQVIVILAGQKSIAITSNNSFNVAIVDIEEEALHFVDRRREFESCLNERFSLQSYLEPKVVMESRGEL